MTDLCFSELRSMNPILSEPTQGKAGVENGWIVKKKKKTCGQSRFLHVHLQVTNVKQQHTTSAAFMNTALGFHSTPAALPFQNLK